MTLLEYELRMKAENLARVDKERDMHWQAFLNHNVQAKKERGKKVVPVYPTFQSFFDYESHLKQVGGAVIEKEDKHKEIKKLVLRANRRGGQDE